MSETVLKGIPANQLIASVNSVGLVQTAKKFGISQSHFCRWLKSQGYVRKAQYVKESPLQPA